MLFVFLFATKAKEAEHVNKNIKKQCWNVWYEAYLSTNDDSSPTTSPTGTKPTTLSLFPSVAISPYNFDRTSVAFNGGGLKKSRKVYCYISKKVSFPYLCFSTKNSEKNLWLPESKIVRLFIFPCQQLTIKEFYMKIIPHRLYGFRVRPTTKVSYLAYSEKKKRFPGSSNRSYCASSWFLLYLWILPVFFQHLAWFISL